jgi:putative transposase
VIEDLNVAGMLRNQRLARHIAGVGMAELRRQIEYKTGWAEHRASRGPLVSLLQDLFGLWRGESQTAPVSAGCRPTTTPTA